MRNPLPGWDATLSWHSPERTHRGRRRRKDVSIGRTAVGKGVFARRRFREEEIIGEITGLLLQNADYGSDYCFDIGDHCYLEPAPPICFVNHSCEPNCEFDWFAVAETGELSARKRVMLFSLRDIRPGEELTLDYHWSAAAAIPCRCHAPNCRGWIVRADQLATIRSSLDREQLAPNGFPGC